jgi:hypothetical protein
LSEIFSWQKVLSFILSLRLVPDYYRLPEEEDDDDDDLEPPPELPELTEPPELEEPELEEEPLLRKLPLLLPGLPMLLLRDGELLW